MKARQLIKYFLYSIVTVGLLIALGFYSLIHSNTIENTNVVKIDCTGQDYATVAGKQIKCDHQYYLFLDGIKVSVKNENIWNIIDKNQEYNVTYEWYGFKTPALKYIKLAGDSANPH
ncbi:hypothetical protein [Gracilibacillus salinarum]|uniref:DUF3139 domain-containing protein n=1 Tax=Gracilibacillus salinarum TaxID=2932255 RepID=A0ABY4GKW2_9BACI|nr:hypothetical protein [Gracilibacillus salinarum]UOQ84864.1 hypothetical protein MUN87_19765 [Gracilibacillus salinarum]